MQGGEDILKSIFGHLNTGLGSVLKHGVANLSVSKVHGLVQLCGMPRDQQNRKRRKPHVYLDPSRFTCTACRASFKLAAGLKRHYAQRRNCRPDSDSDADSSVKNMTFLDSSTLGAPAALELEVDTAIKFPGSAVDQPDGADIPIPASIDPCSDAGNVETFSYSLDIGDTGVAPWMHEPELEPAVSNILNTESAPRTNTTIPSDPSRIGGVFEERYPGAAHVISHSMTRFQHISSNTSYKDAKSSQGVSKACYPFKDLDEVGIVDWLLRNRLSNASINDFVKTEYVSTMLTTTPETFIHLQISAQVKGAPLSFKSAHTLHRCLDRLPCAGPVWKSVILSPKTGTPKEGTPPVLFHRDPIGVVQYLLSNSALQEGIQWSPQKVFEDEEKTQRLFSDMSTGDWWWDTQVCRSASN